MNGSIYNRARKLEEALDEILSTLEKPFTSVDRGKLAAYRHTLETNRVSNTELNPCKVELKPQTQNTDN